MAKPLLEPLIVSLDQAERLRVLHWLQCPLHNLRQDVIDLYQDLCQQLPPQGDALTKVSNLYQDTNTRLLRSYLLDRMEDYLSWQEAQTRRAKQVVDISLLHAYRSRKLEQHLNNRLRRQCKAAEQMKAFATDELYDRYRLQEMVQESHLSHNRQLGEDFNAPNDVLLRAQTAALLRRAAHSMAGTRVNAEQPDIPMLAPYLSVVKTRPVMLEEPGIKVYYHLCRYYLPESPDDIISFSELIEYIKHSLAGFPKSEQADILKLTINQAIRRINIDPSDQHLQEALSLYQLGIDRGLLVEQRRISVFTFSNIIGIAIRLKESVFAREFLEEHANFLPPKSAPEVLALNRARLAYANGQYDEALLHLQKADYRDNLHLMNARDLQIRIYYENGDHEVLRDLIRATRTLISRRKLGYHRKVYRNNLKLVKKLVNLRWDRPKNVAKFREEVLTTHPITEREWLLRQLDEH
ncbi:MAG: hypothetical protein AAF828_00965 [Bacteroidota bacterium]